MKQQRFEFLLRAETPIAHAQENLGNTSIVMTQKVRQPGGRWAKVPIVTGDTMRHGLREASTYCLLECADMLQDSLTENALRLLFAGGMITGSSGSAVNLDEFRQLAELIPPLGLLGGCAQNRIIPGRLQVDPAILVCRETEHLVPEWAREGAGELDGCRAHIEPVQRVRMDPTLDPAKRLLLTPGERTGAEQRLLASEAAAESRDAVAAVKSKSTMMPFSYERVAQGSLFFWSVTATLYTPLDEDTLLVMVGAFLRHCRVGGKRGTGHGHLVPIDARNVSLANFSERMDTLDLVGPDQRKGELFRRHIAERKDRIREFLAKVVA
ncbi:MAG: hypothetical protein AB7S38_29140 [Vulcanimicrobiota bacterium]